MEAAEGVQHPCRPLRLGNPQDEYAEDVEYGLPAMPRACQDISGDIQEDYDGDMTKILGITPD